jgi:hypothetical protein
VAAPIYDVLLGRPTDRSIAISILPSTNLEVYCQYGTQPGIYTAQSPSTNITAGVPSVLTLDGLAADTQIFYRLRYRQSGEPSFSVGAEATFHTQRAAGHDFSFVIEADPHWRDPSASISPDLWRVALANMRADTPDFLFDLGDTFMNEKIGWTNEAECVQLCREVRTNLFNTVGDSLPLFLVNGNHEAELGWLRKPSQPQSNPAVWATRARQQYYPCPVPGSFYSSSTNVDSYVQQPRDGHYAFTWGDALFVVLDPYWSTSPKPSPATCWNWTLGTNQYQWLEQTLSQSSATYKFVFVHNLVGGSFDGAARGGLEYSSYFEWGGNNTNDTWGFTDNRPGWSMPIQDLLLSNSVSAVFHGHDHLFVKQDLDTNGDGRPELIYQECPQPSATNYNTVSTAPSYGYTNGIVQGNSGHLRVRVTSAKATVEYVRAYLPESEGVGKTNRMVTYSYTIAGADPTRMAWSLPDTGQTLSYTPTFGEDGDYTINPPAYVENGDVWIGAGPTTTGGGLVLHGGGSDGKWQAWATDATPRGLWVSEPVAKLGGKPKVFVAAGSLTAYLAVMEDQTKGFVKQNALWSLGFSGVAGVGADQVWAIALKGQLRRWGAVTCPTGQTPPCLSWSTESIKSPVGTKESEAIETPTADFVSLAIHDAEERVLLTASRLYRWGHQPK